MREDDWLLEMARALADVAGPETDDHERRAVSEKIQALHARDQATVEALRQILEITRSHQHLTEAETLEFATAKSKNAARPSPAEGDSWRHLVIGTKLGEGAHGVVYSARDSVLDRPVALKLVPSSGSDSESGLPREVVEGRLLARVKHPNVVTVFGADELAGLIGIWMEYVQGESLTEVVERQGMLSEREAALIGIEVARAAAALHQRGIVHRDIKAQNVMRERGGRIVLMDLGVSLDTPSRHPDEPVRGTPLYLAPELLEGGEANPRTDVYGLGVLLFFLCTGRYPVEGSNWNELRSSHRRGQRLHIADLRPDVDRRFAALLHRAIAPRAAERYQTMGELEAALTAFLADLTSAETPVPVRRPSLRRAALLAALVFATVGGAVTLLLTKQETPAVPSTRLAVVADIENDTDDPALDEAIELLLELALLENRDLEPMSERARQAALVRMRHEDAELPLERAREMMRREGLAAVFGGSVTQLGDELTVRLIGTGPLGRRQERVVTAARADLVSALGEQIPGLLAEVPAASSGITDGFRLEEVTTESLEALERFSEAQQLHREGAYDAAIALLETIVDIDPGFAMAWNRLADYQSGAGRHAASVVSSARSYELREKTTEHERRYIQALYHRIRMQHYEAAQELERLAALGGPSLANTYRQLALAYEWVPDLNSATRAARQAAATDPHDVINRGLYAMFEAKRGNTDLALDLVEQTRQELEAADQPYLFWTEGMARQIAGDLQDALEAYSAMVDSGSATYVRFGRQLRAQVLAELGETDAALADLELLTTEAELADDDNAAFVSRLWTARLMKEVGDDAALRSFLQSNAALLSVDSPRTIERGRQLASLLAHAGLDEHVLPILQLLTQLAERFPSSLARASVLKTDGLVALASGEIERGVTSAESALREHRDYLGLWVASRAARASDHAERELLLLTELVEQRKGEILRFGFVGDWLAARNRLEEILPVVRASNRLSTIPRTPPLDNTTASD